MIESPLPEITQIPALPRFGLVSALFPSLILVLMTASRLAGCTRAVDEVCDQSIHRLEGIAGKIGTVTSVITTCVMITRYPS